MIPHDKNILVIGELNIDLLLNNISGFPAIGRETLAADMHIILGSSSAIFAANIAVLGTATAFCGMVGNDYFGRFILDELQRKNIDTKNIIIDTSKTGLTVVMNYGEDRANVTYAGAMERFAFSDIPEDLAAFGHLHLSSYFLQKTLKPDITLLFKNAKAKGLTTSLDLQWDPDNKWDFPYSECLPYVDVFLPNEAEILSLTNSESVEKAIEKIAPFAEIIVVKRGTKGALAFNRGTTFISPAMLHNYFVDAIGAGDSFNAGFIYKYLKGDSLDNCLRFGNLCGAVNTTATGGTGAFRDLPLFTEKAKLLFNTEV